MNTQGTSGKDAIQGFGGFNFSQFNFQDRSTPGPRANFNEQARDSTNRIAGKNALNAPKATFQQKIPYDPNEINNWREQTLRLPPPGQVAGGFGSLAFASADTSLLQWKLHHGFGQDDFALRHLLTDEQIAPSPNAAGQYQSSPFVHSDIGTAPAVLNQNLIEIPTVEIYPEEEVIRVRGRHDHTNLKEHHTPTITNESNVDTGNHVVFATDDLLRRPLLLSDLPSPSVLVS